MKILVVSLVAVATVLIGFAQKQERYQFPVYHGNSKPPAVTHRQPPPWAKSKLEVTRTDFSKVREAMVKECGVYPEAAYISVSRAEAAYQAYLTGHRQIDAFKALYLYELAQVGEPPIKYEALWNVLPSDEYEVARLRFLVCAHDVLNDVNAMGERLLAKNPNDYAVLGEMATLYAFIGTSRNLPKADAYATKFLKAVPCAHSYFVAGRVKWYLFYFNKDKKAASPGVTYLKKYLTLARPGKVSEWGRGMAEDWIKDMQKAS